MIDWPAVAAVMAVLMLGVISPGPNFVAVAHRAVSAGRSDAFVMALGVATVSALWSSAAMFGIGALFRLFPWLFWALKIGGGAYLVYFGLRLIRQAHRPLPEPSERAPGGYWRAYRAGVITNLANPKAVAFYASVFSTAVPRHATTATLAVTVALVVLFVVAWYGAVGAILSSGAPARAYRRAKTGVERVCGGAIMLFGVKMAVSR